MTSQRFKLFRFQLNPLDLSTDRLRKTVDEGDFSGELVDIAQEDHVFLELF